MTNYGRVYGTSEPDLITITSKNVFVASNIQPYSRTIDGKQDSGYSYDYLSYTKDEYLQLMIEENEYLRTELLDTQSALCDLYELIEGGLDNG